MFSLADILWSQLFCRIVLNFSRLVIETLKLTYFDIKFELVLPHLNQNPRRKKRKTKYIKVYSDTEFLLSTFINLMRKNWGVSVSQIRLLALCRIIFFFFPVKPIIAESILELNSRNLPRGHYSNESDPRQKKKKPSSCSAGYNFGVHIIARTFSLKLYQFRTRISYPSDICRQKGNPFRLN